MQTLKYTGKYLFLLFLICLSARSYSEFDYSTYFNYQNLHWKTLNSEHFTIHYHSDIETFAKKISVVAEKEYAKYAGMFEMAPGSRFRFILRGYNDIADYMEEPFFSDLSFSLYFYPIALSGKSNSLEMLFRYKFAQSFILEIVSSSRLPWNRYIAISNLPLWFSDGLATALSGWSFPFEEAVMSEIALTNGFFSQKRLKNFFFYDYFSTYLGHVQSKYLVSCTIDKHGTEKLVKFLDQFSSRPTDFYNVYKSVTGTTVTECFESWKKNIEMHYLPLTEGIELLKDTGEFIKTPGVFKRNLCYCPLSKTLYFAASDSYKAEKYDIFSMGENGVKKVLAGVNSGFSMMCDGKILFSKRITDRNGFYYNDIFMYDPKNKKESRITSRARAIYPAFGEDDNIIYYTRISGGRADIMRYSITEKQSSVYFAGQAWQSFRPLLSPDKKRMLYCRIEKETTNFEICDVKTRKNLNFPEFESVSNARWKNSSVISFAGSQGGIYHMYEFNVNTGAVEQITSVSGGIFEGCYAEDKECYIVSALMPTCFGLYYIH